MRRDRAARGRLSAVTGPDGYTVGFDVDPLGRITGAYNEEGHRVSLTLDADGRPRSVTDPNGLTTSVSYHDSSQDGLLKRTTLPKVSGQSQARAVEIAQYDGAGRPTRIEAIAADGSVRSGYRFYDERGRITREVGPLVSSGDTSRPVTCTVYTVLGDVKEVWAGGTTTAYLYDEAHRLTEIRAEGDTGPLIGAAIHDADGHLTKLCEGETVTTGTSDCTAGGTGASALTLTWNALDHLQSATRTGANAIAESYAYDDTGRRIGKTSAGATTAYLYDGDDIYAEWSGGPSGSLSGMPGAVYVHGVGTDSPILRLTGRTSHQPASLSTSPVRPDSMQFESS